MSKGMYKAELKDPNGNLIIYIGTYQIDPNTKTFTVDPPPPIPLIESPVHIVVLWESK